MTPILPALELIGSNNASFMTTGELAGACHLSVAQFGRIFKQIMTQSPADYIRMVKLQKACELLYSTEMSILISHWNPVFSLSPPLTARSSSLTRKVPANGARKSAASGRKMSGIPLSSQRTLLTFDAARISHSF